jgi:hypothetical protein
MGRSVKALLVWGALGGLLLVCLIATVVAWTYNGLPHISMHGWIALTLGTVLSLAVGFGLMALVFHSARSGHDDDIGVG